ncbi:MAG: lamin tail domain-containing protein, partial [Candidatus Marinimicrobia bacterium]|nr:lamin tail domain-containing protein [Candidatus Neomarinimicrobiota bacterium]
MISEVMIDPQGTDSPNEFVELTNISDEPVDLTGWRLGDLNSTDELSSDSLILWPGEYAVIFEGDYSPDSGAYAGLLPPGTHILFVDDNSIGNGLANSADSLFLRDSTGTIVDRMGWAEASAEGFTLEKVLLGECDTPGNWRSSLQPLGTPGNINSVAGPVTAAVVRISEIMYRPLSMDPEWVEVFNPSGSVINLKQWELWDQTKGATLPEYYLIPGGYLVLASDSTSQSGWPAGIALVTPAGFPILNNSGDQVTLTDPYSVVIDQLDYTPFPQTPSGISLEKVILTGDNREGNWRHSRQLHGTPGAPNSVAGEVIDLALDSLTGTFDAAAGRFEITAFVSNAGLEASGGRLLADGNEVADIDLLSPGANATVSFFWTPPPHYGWLELAVWIAVAQDYDAAN